MATADTRGRRARRPRGALPGSVEALRFDALGGTCELYAVDPVEPLADTAEWMLGLHRRLTRFDPSSELSRLNAGAGEWAEVSEILHDLLEEALVAYETSGGLVHVGVLPALVAAGYDRTFEEVRAQGMGVVSHGIPDLVTKQCSSATLGHQAGMVLHDTSQPTPRPRVSQGDGRSAVDHCRPAVIHCRSSDAPYETSPTRRAWRDDGMLDREGRPIPGSDLLKVRPEATRVEALPQLPELLQLRPGAARLRPGAAIDLGGIAKGWIADRAVERMGPNSLANCAGDLMARGAGPRADGRDALDGPTRGEGWPVRFADRTLLLDGMAAATSGTTKRRWGPESHHIIDPRTGRPAASDLVEVSVLATSALDAEVLAKTALLLGSAEAPAYLEGRALGWALLDEERAA